MDKGKGSLGAWNGADDIPRSWLATSANSPSAIVKSNQVVSSIPMPKSSLGVGTGTTTTNANSPSVIVASSIPKPKLSLGSSTALQSTWIQRLRSFGPASDADKDEPCARKPPVKNSHVWTHFSKDFSSCRRPDAQAQTLSLPDGQYATEVVLYQNNCDLPGKGTCDLPEAAGTRDDDMMARGKSPTRLNDSLHRETSNPPICREDNLRVPSGEGTGSSGSSFRTEIVRGLGGKPRIERKVEALVPCAQESGKQKTENRIQSGEGLGHGSQAKQPLKAGASLGMGMDLAALRSGQAAASGKVSLSKTVFGFGPLRVGPGKPPLPPLKPGSNRATPASWKGALHPEGSGFFDGVEATGRCLSSAPSSSRMLDCDGASADADRRLCAHPVGEFMESSQRSPTSLSQSLDIGKRDLTNSLQAVPARPDEGTPSHSGLTGTMAGKHNSHTGKFSRNFSENDLLMRPKAGGDISLVEHVGDSHSQRAATRNISASDCLLVDKVWHPPRRNNSWNRLSGQFNSSKQQVASVADWGALASFDGLPTVDKAKADRGHDETRKGVCERLPAENLFCSEGKGRNKGSIEPRPFSSLRSGSMARLEPSFFSRRCEENISLGNDGAKDEPQRVTGKGIDLGSEFVGQAKCPPQIPDLSVDETGRPGIPEIGTREYWSSWIQIFEDSGLSQPEEEASSTDSLPREYFLEQYHQSRLKCITKSLESDSVEKFEKRISGSKRFVKTDLETQASSDSSQHLGSPWSEDDGTFLGVGEDQNRLKPGNSASVDEKKQKEEKEAMTKWQRRNTIRKKDVGQEAAGTVPRPVDYEHGHALASSPDLCQSGASYIKGRRESRGQSTIQMYGSATADDNSAGASTVQWLQRWWSSASSGAASVKPLRPNVEARVRYNDLAVKASLGSSSNALFTNSAGRLAEPCLGQRLHGIRESSGGAGNRYMDTAQGLPDSGSESMLGSWLPTSESGILAPDHYCSPSLGAMVVIGKTARQMGTSPPKQRGSSSIWPSVDATTHDFRSVELPEDLNKTSQQKTHIADK